MKYTFLLVFPLIICASGAQTQYAGGVNDGVNVQQAKDRQNQLPDI